jgi:predicted DCC family thiol-disulfide oxidoreductase YuxK
MITVFYDGKCSLCRREIEHYIKIAQPNIFIWVDISRTPHPFLKLGLTIEEGLKSLHVTDASGNIHKGIYAFVLIWKHLPSYWPFLSKILDSPYVMKVAQKFYTIFAEWRYKRMGYNKCDI